jgi:hypothetical protein
MSCTATPIPGRAHPERILFASSRRVTFKSPSYVYSPPSSLEITPIGDGIYIQEDINEEKEAEQTNSARMSHRLALSMQVREIPLRRNVKSLDYRLPQCRMNFKKQPLFPRRLGLPVGISRS